METVLIILVVAILSVICHGLFTGLALLATWYFGHVAEKKLLNEAKEIHKEVTAQIAKMNKDAKDYDKIDEFLALQQKVLTGFRSEIARGVGEILDGKIQELKIGAGKSKSETTAERLLSLGEVAVAGILNQQV